MNLVDPNIATSKQRQLKELAKLAVKHLTDQDPIDVIHALALALASASSSAGVTHIEDVMDEVAAMFRSIESSKPSVVRTGVQIVSPGQFKQLAERYGVKF